MNVGQLKELLEDIDPDVNVWISRDEEGNGYNVCHEIFHGKALIWEDEGEIQFDEIDGYDQEPEEIVVFWP